MVGLVVRLSGKLKPVFFRKRGVLANGWDDVVAITADGSGNDPMSVHSSDARPGEEIAYECSVGADGRAVVHLRRGEYAAVPDLWYVMIVRPGGNPPNICLVAFACGSFPKGTVVDVSDRDALAGIDPKTQVAAIQWGYGDPKIHQVFVHPDHRRKYISVALIGAADIVNMCFGKSGERAIYGGDVTTDGGEHLRRAWSMSPRVIPRQGIVHS